MDRVCERLRVLGRSAFFARLSQAFRRGSIVNGARWRRTIDTVSRWTTSLIVTRQGARILRGYLRIFRTVAEVGNCRTKRWHTDDETREIVTLDSLLLDPNKCGSRNAEIHEDGQRWWRTRTLESLANCPLHELIRIVMDHAIDALAERERWSTVAWMTIEQAGMCTRRSRRALWRSQSACWSSLRPSVRSSRRLQQCWEGSGEIRMDRTRAMGIVDYWRDRGDEEGSLLFSCESIFGEVCARNEGSVSVLVVSQNMESIVKPVLCKSQGKHGTATIKALLSRSASFRFSPRLLETIYFACRQVERSPGLVYRVFFKMKRHESWCGKI